MGLRVILEIVDQQGIVIDDLAALNLDAREGEIELEFDGEIETVSGGVNELLTNISDHLQERGSHRRYRPGAQQPPNSPPQDIPFYAFEDGKLLIPNMYEYEMDGYGTGCEVWGCYGEVDAKILARHVTAGKIVLMLDIEGNPNEYFIITPGKCVHTEKLSLSNF